LRFLIFDFQFSGFVVCLVIGLSILAVPLFPDLHPIYFFLATLLSIVHPSRLERVGPDARDQGCSTTKAGGIENRALTRIPKF
jgi:hypothetical protein